MLDRKMIKLAYKITREKKKRRGEVTGIHTKIVTSTEEVPK